MLGDEQAEALSISAPASAVATIARVLEVAIARVWQQHLRARAGAGSMLRCWPDAWGSDPLTRRDERATHAMPRWTRVPRSPTPAGK